MLSLRATAEPELTGTGVARLGHGANCTAATGSKKPAACLKSWRRSRECTGMQASKSETNLALAHPGKIYHSWGAAKLLLGIMLSAHSLLFSFPTETSQIIRVLNYLRDHSLNHLKLTFRIYSQSFLSAVRICEACISKISNNVKKKKHYRVYVSLTAPTCMFENW